MKKNNELKERFVESELEKNLINFIKSADHSLYNKLYNEEEAYLDWKHSKINLNLAKQKIEVDARGSLGYLIVKIKFDVFIDQEKNEEEKIKNIKIIPNTLMFCFEY